MAKRVFRWTHIISVDELEAFFTDILTAIRPQAQFHGYAIGLHGSMRRDLDLIAVPWTEQHADKDVLAKEIHEAACGFSQDKYEWEQKPCGRWATSMPVCWIDYEHAHDGTGHIDLSVVTTSTRGPC